MFYTSKVSYWSAQMFGVLMLCQLAACNLQEPQSFDALEPDPGKLSPITASRTCDNQPAGYTMAFDTPWNVLPVLQPEWSSEGYHFYAGQGSTLSIVQVPEKSGFWAHASVATVRTAAAMTPTRANFM